MKHDVIYYYKRSHRQQAKQFFYMTLFCWVYVIALFVYEAYTGERSFSHS